ncbi:hypothetical protein ACFST9_21270 [Hymenobacter monticola]|uniref:Uncharacterized protein n=1 Tax=Hymenobacter monticola TaxID=1705399 RepID=A0ABY4B5C9_9BACT|nr:hypothetical protein [Hymenobacter monticola]UOE34370.1 hypothetical protein MTP16_01640 [Hymenobacter monticola]
MAAPYNSQVKFECELPAIDAVLLKLFEVTGLLLNCDPVESEGGLWHLISPITSMEISVMHYSNSYVLFFYPFDVSVWRNRPNSNEYLHESALFALQELGGQPEETLETWAGESWDIAKWRWNPKHLDGGGRN